MCLDDAKTWSSLQFNRSTTVDWSTDSRAACSCCSKESMGTLAPTPGFTITNQQFCQQSNLSGCGELLPRIPIICNSERYFCSALCNASGSSAGWANDPYANSSSVSCPNLKTHDTCFMCDICRWWSGCLWRTLCNIRELLSLLSSGTIYSWHTDWDIFNNCWEYIKRETGWRPYGASVYRGVNSFSMYFTIIGTVLCKKTSESVAKDCRTNQEDSEWRSSNRKYTFTKFSDNRYRDCSPTADDSCSWDKSGRSIIKKACSTTSSRRDKVQFKRSEWCALVAT